jgi:hypothetical protein
VLCVGFSSFCRRFVVLFLLACCVTVFLRFGFAYRLFLLFSVLLFVFACCFLSVWMVVVFSFAVFRLVFGWLLFFGSLERFCFQVFACCLLSV